MTGYLIVAVALTLGAGDDAILATLRREHPRLIARSDDLARVKSLIAENEKAAAIYQRLTQEAQRLLSLPPVERQLVRRSSPTMLDVSRRCVDRVYTLATVYRIDGDRRYADRAIRELLAVADFPDWNPAVFLDTAEMTHAAAIGYDWLFEVMTSGEKQKVRQAIVAKGLREAERAYRKAAGWTKATHNWNLVCNAGATLGALAVAEDEPQLAEAILRSARASMPIALNEYAPDGAWAEGPGYWNYATRYATYAMAALESALGADFGLSAAPGFSVTGEFCMQMAGPTGLTFNFADGSPAGSKAPMLYWLSRKFNRPVYAWHQREQIGGTSPLDLWWFDPRGAKPVDLPNDRWFRHTDVVFMRSAWHDPRAVFVGFKAGDNKANHSHLELGTFVLDACGQRWVVAPGGDSYGLPGYFGAQRWSYYRANTHGQNTLLIDGQNQDPKARASMAVFHSAPERAHAVADLSKAYAGQASSVRRGIAILGRRRVLVQDEIEGLRGGGVVWQVHTPATIELQGQQALLRYKREALHARILAPAGAEFSVETVNLPPPQRPMTGIRKLAIKPEASSATLRLAVLFSPGHASAGAAPTLTPLSNWVDGKGASSALPPARDKSP